MLFLSKYKKLGILITCLFLINTYALEHNNNVVEQNENEIIEEVILTEDVDQVDEINIDQDDATQDDNEEEEEIIEEVIEEIVPEDTKKNAQYFISKTIKEIIITRNNPNGYLTEDAILSKIPYSKDEIFNTNKTTELIKSLYNISQPYGYFSQVFVMAEDLGDNLMNLHVITYEKPELEEIKLTGNKKVSTEDIEEKLKLNEIHVISEADAQRIATELKNLYKERNFHLVEITTSIELTGNKAILTINIEENQKSLIKRVFFKGNHSISDKKLRTSIFTREDWLLGFLDKAGTYSKDYFEGDKHIIENVYRSYGFINAKVTNAEIVMDPKTKHFNVTFYIEEGLTYCIKDVHVQGNDILPEEYLLQLIPVKPGNLYSVKDIRDSINTLRTLWGQYGYIFADIEPAIVPDDKTRTVNVSFYSELGGRVHVNRINIIGNKKTLDKVIRRRLAIQEGDLLTTTKMDYSKDKVEFLGFFDANNGVNWKINRINDDWADLDLIVNEVKTGHINANMGFGGSPKDMSSASTSLRIGGQIQETNLMGRGISIGLSGYWSKEEWSANFNLTDPWFLDRPLLASYNFYVIKSDYFQELPNVRDFTEKIVGTSFALGYTLPGTSWLNATETLGKIGFDDYRYSCSFKTVFYIDENGNQQQRFVFIDEFNTFECPVTKQKLLDALFRPGPVVSVLYSLGQDYRNNAIHPTKGYKWIASNKLAFGSRDNNFGYDKFEADILWYTPLIDSNKLILGLHGFFGYIAPFSNKTVPYRELYHIGGPATVRGYEYGQISPMFAGDSIGAKKAFVVNAELIFPIASDFSIKGILFYDGGAGWDTANQRLIPPDDLKCLRNNSFEYRHAIGFGFRMLRPTPLRVDWGFKLDRKKGEKGMETHFSMSRDF